MDPSYHSIDLSCSETMTCLVFGWVTMTVKNLLFYFILCWKDTTLVSFYISLMLSSMCLVNLFFHKKIYDDYFLCQALAF